MDLQAYFKRIGFSGRARADLKTFQRVHHAHANSLTYENLDVAFGVPVTRDASAIFDKIVTRRRGGWCYEMNGLLAWALEEIGFDLTRLAGAVMRDAMGDVVIGNHLVLLVTIDGEPWMGDVGFGDGLIDPVPLAAGDIRVGPLKCRLEANDDGWWRYFNDPRSGGPTFDFNVGVTDERLLDDRCRYLQTDPSSPFVLNAVAQRWRDGVHYSLRGRVLRVLGADWEEKSVITSAAEYVRTLRETFNLDLAEAAELWSAICRRHEELFAGSLTVA